MIIYHTEIAFLIQGILLIIFDEVITIDIEETTGTLLYTQIMFLLDGLKI